VVPHHGSATSSSPAFVESVRASLAVVSAAHDNRWRFPREEVVRRWRAAGAAMLVTGDAGAIAVRFENGSPVVELQRRSAKRYWHSDSRTLPGAGGTGAL
jgi:competence protein ComEC